MFYWRREGLGARDSVVCFLLILRRSCMGESPEKLGDDLRGRLLGLSEDRGRELLADHQCSILTSRSWGEHRSDVPERHTGRIESRTWVRSRPRAAGEVQGLEILSGSGLDFRDTSSACCLDRREGKGREAKGREGKGGSADNGDAEAHGQGTRGYERVARNGHLSSEKKR